MEAVLDAVSLAVRCRGSPPSALSHGEKFRAGLAQQLAKHAHRCETADAAEKEEKQIFPDYRTVEKIDLP